MLAPSTRLGPYEILSPINHPYADIPLMAKYHHERLDGRGYPDGLTDEQIPLGAKIVSPTRQMAIKRALTRLFSPADTATPAEVKTA